MIPNFLRSAISRGWVVERLDGLLKSNFISGHLDGNHGGLYPRTSEFVSAGVKYISANALINGKTDLSKSKFLTAERAAQFKKGVASDGDVLFAHNATVGPVAILHTEDEYVILSTSLTYYRCNHDKLDNEYLCHYMASPSFIRQYEKVMKQTTRNQIPITAQRDFYFVLPPLPEQRKIAKILSTWDKAIATTEKLIAASKQQKKALMQQLLTGKKRLVNPETGRVFEGEWDEVRLGDVAIKVGSGSTPRGGSEAYKQVGIPLIRSQNILWGRVDLSDVAYIDDTQHRKMKNSKVFKNDVLLNITGASIGRVAISDIEEANVNQHVCIIRCGSKVHPEYLSCFLLSFFGQKQIEQCQAGGNRQGLNFEQIKSFRLSLPLLEEQQKIAQVLTAADQETEHLESKLAHFQQEKKALMQQLLTGKRRVKVEEIVFS